VNFLQRNLEDPVRFARIKRLFYIGLAVVALAEIVLPHIFPGGESHFSFEDWPAWGSLYGLISCVAMGSAFSLAPRLGQSAYFRPHNRDPEIPGLYIVGAGTHPGAGVPGVINSGKATARLVIDDFKLGAEALAS
jgi:hypothetical protein